MQTETRQLTRADIPFWAALLAESEAVDRTGEHYSEADLLEEMDNPEAEVGEDFVGAFDGGRLVAVATVLSRGETEGAFKVSVNGTVAPTHRGRGLGTALTGRAVRRAGDLAAQRRPDLPVKVTAAGLSGNGAQAELLAHLGFAPDRWTFLMRVQLSDVPPMAPPVPEGYQIVPYDDAWADALRRAHNTAFGGDHPGFTPWSETAWATFVTGSHTFRPGLTRVVVPHESEEIAAYVVSNEFEAHAAATGRREAHVSRVGTLAGHRGRGLAAAVLGHCLRAYADGGYDEASLHVDADNPSGALRLYQRAGFEVAATWTNYVMSLAPA